MPADVLFGEDALENQTNDPLANAKQGIGLLPIFLGLMLVGAVAGFFSPEMLVWVFTVIAFAIALSMVVAHAVIKPDTVPTVTLLMTLALMCLLGPLWLFYHLFG